MKGALYEKHAAAGKSKPFFYAFFICGRRFLKLFKRSAGYYRGRLRKDKKCLRTAIAI